MKCKIPEISWHNRDPVLSVDIQPKTNASNNHYRLASGGTDAHVLIWYMKLTASGEHGDIELDLAADLARHQRAVNVVKWSPSGKLLASGDDESVVFIWKQKSESEPLNILDPTNDQDKEVWITLKVLRGHMEDIYDLSWAPNSLYLVTGSVDNSAMIWDVHKGKSMSILKDHKGFVQGVAWDPKNQYIATLSTDRYMRIFDIQTKKVLCRVSKGTLPVPEDNSLHGKRMRLFHDDTLQTFFRRLSFTPDGKLLLTPAGVTDYDGCTRPLNTTYVFSRYGFRQPAIVLPCPDQYTVAVKCCPLLYKLRPFTADKNPPVVPLPYRMIFGVATKSSVYFYDTQQRQPFAVISNIHYTRLTDITWSNDGRIVVVSSTDGFCSLITFEKGELGEEYEDSEAALETALAQVTKKPKKQKDNEVIPKSRKPSTDDTNVAVQKETAILRKEMSALQNEQQLEAAAKTVTEDVLVEIGQNTISKNNCAENNGNTTQELPEKSVKKIVEEEVKVICNAVDDKETMAKRADDNKPKHMAIKRKSGVDPEVICNTPEEKSELKATPIPIKRKPGINSEVTNNKPESKPDLKATPIAIKRKSGPISEPTSNTAEEKLELKATQCKFEKTHHNDKITAAKPVDDKPTPIAIKRKPGTISESTNKITVEKSELKATPIPIKRKPGLISELINTTEEKSELKATPTGIQCNPTVTKLKDNINSNPTDIKSKPELTDNTDEDKPENKAISMAAKCNQESPTKNDAKVETSNKMTEETISKTGAIMTNKVLAAEIIIDKEILSSDEKFESPEKKSRPATPITIRRHPRTPVSLPQTPTSMANILKNQADTNQSPISSLSKESGSSVQDKKAKPIAVRRTPRSIISSPCVVNTTSLVEEAMDAWPLNKDDNAEIAKETLPKKFITEAGITPLPLSETTCERTEDIRLIYEETNEEAPVKECSPKTAVEVNKTDIIEKNTVDPPKPQTPSGNKTPRRVALKTISTPKSKKKLIE